MSFSHAALHAIGGAAILYTLGHLIYSMSGHPREWMLPARTRR